MSASYIKEMRLTMARITYAKCVVSKFWQKKAKGIPPGWNRTSDISMNARYYSRMLLPTELPAAERMSAKAAFMPASQNQKCDAIMER